MWQCESNHHSRSVTGLPRASGAARTRRVGDVGGAASTFIVAGSPHWACISEYRHSCASFRCNLRQTGFTGRVPDVPRRHSFTCTTYLSTFEERTALRPGRWTTESVHRAHREKDVENSRRPFGFGT